MKKKTKAGTNKFGCSPGIWKKFSSAKKRKWSTCYHWFLSDLKEAHKNGWTDDVLAHNYACLIVG